MSLNPLLLRTASPPIPEVREWAARYSGKRGPLIDLSQAAPGTPPHAALLKRLGAAAASVEASRYGGITGDENLLETYASHVSTLYGGEVDVGELAITAGCNQAFFVTMILLAQAGEAVLLPSPWYFNYKMTLDMLGIEARPLPCDADDGFVPDPERAESLSDNRLRAIVLVSPNNPTGAIYPPEVISRFHALCLRRGMVLVVDETYRDFLDPVGARPHDVLSKGSWRGSFISLYSFSKTYCIPGHRLGAIVADKATITEIAKILDCIQICASRTPQIALTWAINALASWREANTRDIIGRLAVFREALSSADGWQADSFGAYFAYVRHPGTNVSSATMARRLAEHVGILALPGSYFGERQEQYLRLAFANVDKAAISAVQSRLAAWAMTD